MELAGRGPRFTTRVPLWLATLASGLLVALMYWLRLKLAGSWMLPIGYGIPVVVVTCFRRRALLWMTAGAFVLLTAAKFFVFLPHTVPDVALPTSYDWFAGALVILDLLVVAGIGHFWIASTEWFERQNQQLDRANADLVTREEEIARQNEELQSQTEELERQSEELRVTNEELAERERTLETLLSLSRALTTDLSREETLERICQTVGQLVHGPTTASAIVETVGDRIFVRCHHGFGPDGVASENIPLDRTFAALVLARGRTAYLEDLEQRPDLMVPQPKNGERMRSILAAPLRVGGWPIGTLEILSREKTVWSEQQISLVESLAAQTSVSLEASQLYQTVNEERHRFETVLRTVPFGIGVISADAGDVRFNPAGAALFQVQADTNVAAEANTWPLFQAGRPMAPSQLSLLRACREGIEVRTEEIELYLPGGRRLVLLTNARPIRDKEGRVLGAVAAFVDITPQKELQRELDLRRREAEEASVRKTRFLAAVSHDIRTPANAISLLAELLKRTASNPAMAQDVPELAEELRASAMSLVGLLSDVLDLARFDSGRIELQESEFTLSDLFAEEQRQLLPLAREKGLRFEWSAPPSTIRLRTDRIKLSRIIGNLVGNAIKFTEQGTIRVAAAANDEGLNIRVSDSGVGIPPESISHIFDEFIQLRNPERDRNKGIGLGLTICKRLVDAIGGDINVESTPGEGSTFTVKLPQNVILNMQ